MSTRRYVGLVQLEVEVVEVEGEYGAQEYIQNKIIQTVNLCIIRKFTKKRATEIASYFPM